MNLSCKNKKKFFVITFSTFFTVLFFVISGINSKVSAISATTYNFTLPAMNGGECYQISDSDNVFGGYRVSSATIKPSSKNYTIKSINFNDFDNFRYDDHLIFTINDIVVFATSYRIYNNYLPEMGAVLDNLRIYKESYFYPGINNYWLKDRTLRQEDYGVCIGGVTSGTGLCQIPASQTQGQFTIGISDSLSKELYDKLNSPNELTLRVYSIGDNDSVSGTQEDKNDFDCSCCSNSIYSRSNPICKQNEDGSSPTCLAGKIEIEYYDDFVPTASITGDEIIELNNKNEGSGNYNLKAEDINKEGDIGQLGVYYKMIKDKNGISVTDNWHGINFNHGVSEFSCSGVSNKCEKDISWTVNGLTEGTYQLTVNAYEPDYYQNPRIAYCTGNPNCGDSGEGIFCLSGRENTGNFLDCDPFHEGNSDTDMIEVQIVKCGNGTKEADEKCDNGPLNSSVSTCYSASGTATSICTTSCVFKSCGYCGDGIVQLANEECDGDSNCTDECLWQDKPWFRTNYGDVYSYKGVSQSPSSTMNLSKYLCLNTSGVFYNAYRKDDPNKENTCSEQSIVGVTESNWIKETESLKEKTTSEYLSMIEKLETRFNKKTTFTFGEGDKIINGNRLLMLRTWNDEMEVSSNLVYLTKDLIINKDIKNNCLNQSNCSLLIVSEGNVTITNNVSRVDAFILAKGQIYVESGSNALVINGGLVAIGKEVSVVAVSLKRNLGSGNINPSEVINYDPRYIDILKNIFGQLGNINFSESGVY